MTSNNSKHPGFTLTEILVVIGIVLLLAALLFPIITRVKEVGRQTTCASNLRQIGFALQAYVQDSGGFFPVPARYGNNCVWAHRLQSYTKTPTVFECPSYPQGKFDPACSDSETDGDTELWFNGGYDWNNTQPRNLFALPQNAIRQPANMVIICDAKATQSALMDPKAPSITTVEGLSTTDMGARHGNGVNALYADGHVKWLSMEKLLDKSLWNYR